MKEAVAKPKEEILALLKTYGPQTAQTLGKKLCVTAMAVRQHLYQMEKEGLVGHEDKATSVGRPSRFWNLQEASQGKFPDSHSELAVGLLHGIRRVFGEKGWQQLVQDRVEKQLAEYSRQIPANAGLKGKVAALAKIRSQEGYMAQWEKRKEGGFLLIENHCPICSAAKTCTNLCDGELELFGKLLGKGVNIQRSEHILADARRCVYEIWER